jgi:hypothetical protein
MLGRDWNNDQLHPCAAELEMNVIDEYLHYIEPLYRRALHSKYHHLGGLDDYLTQLLISRKPADQRAALSRLRMIWSVLSDLFQVCEKQEQCRKAQVRLASHFLGQTTTRRGCERPLISAHVLRQQLNSKCLSPFVFLVLAMAQTSMKHRREFVVGVALAVPRKTRSHLMTRPPFLSMSPIVLRGHTLLTLVHSLY